MGSNGLQLGALIVLVCSTLGLTVGPVICAGQARGNSALLSPFEPLDSFDDVDAHTVSAGSGRENYFRALNNSRAASQTLPFGQRLGQAAEEARDKQRRQIVQSSIGGLIEQAQQLEKSTIGAAEPSVRTTERPKHWSALENYYQKLREASLLKSLQNQDDLLYAITQQSSGGGAADERLGPAYTIRRNPIELQTADFQQQVLPIYRGQQQPAAAAAAIPSHTTQLQTKPNFWLPTGGAGLAPSSSQAPSSLPVSSSSSSSLANGGLVQVGQASRFDELAQFILGSGEQSAAGAKLAGGWANSAGQELPVVVPQGGAGTKTSLTRLELERQQQQLAASPFLLRPTIEEQQAPIGVGQANLQLPLGSLVEQRLARERQLESNRLLMEALKQRLQHQQQLFGSWWDERRGLELLQEETNCGPRNSLAAAKQQAEFPSHMGVFNGSQASEDNYLCAATWLHERFALTLASCVAAWNATGATRAPLLSVRAAEWLLNGSSAGATGQRRVGERVHLFPRWPTQALAANSSSSGSEHNLALLEWAEPIALQADSYAWPACQTQSRATLRTSACSVPVRNTSFSEYFDPNGEGETKLKRNVRMIELPVRLFANDEPECQRQTRQSHFNFRHPNLICSADSRRPNVRSKLGNLSGAIGAGIYCNEAASLTLVSIVSPISSANSTFGFLDLSYYRPWMRAVIGGRRE